MLAVNDDCCRENLCPPFGRLLCNRLPGNGWSIPASLALGLPENWMRLSVFMESQLVLSVIMGWR
jgi:hypothetical protein